MTGRTHDLAAFTAMTYIVATQPLVHVSLATALVAFTANMVGGLAPDIDQPTAKLWNDVRFGRVLGKLIAPMLGRHRFISHSLVGLFLFGFAAKFLLGLASNVLLVDMNIVWWSFIIGFISHLIMDSFTHDGVPWLFPLPIHFGFPPLSFLRMKTGGFIEKAIVFPGLILLNFYFFYSYYGKFLDFLRHYIK